MKGFGIEVKNDLLDPKHVERMGQSVWLYMWLLDKITSVTEDGKGNVLGGRPITYEEIKKELGISADTLTRWIQKLEQYPYIIAIRDSHGIFFTVLKAHKRFGNRIRRNAESDTAEMRNHGRENAESLLYNKTVNNKEPATGAGSSSQVIDLFKSINPSYSILFKRKPQHDAAKRLLEREGMDRLVGAIAFVAANRSNKFCPRISTPIQLEEKWASLQTFGLTLKNNNINRRGVII